MPKSKYDHTLSSDNGIQSSVYDKQVRNSRVLSLVVSYGALPESVANEERKGLELRVINSQLREKKSEF